MKGLTRNVIRLLLVMMCCGVLGTPLFAESETTSALASSEQIQPTDIQKALKEAGYYKGPVDGIVGKKTKEAVRQFQEAHDLKVDGKCGPQTWGKLKAYLEEAAEIDEQAAAPAVSAEEINTTTNLDEASYDESYSEFNTPLEDESELKQKLIS